MNDSRICKECQRVIIRRVVTKRLLVVEGILLMECVVIEKHCLMMRQVNLFFSSALVHELLVGWVFFVGLVVVRVLKEDFVEGTAMYTDVEFFQGFVASCKILRRQAHTIVQNKLVGSGYRWGFFASRVVMKLGSEVSGTCLRTSAL